MRKSSFIQMVAAGVAATLLSLPAVAQWVPIKPVKLIVPYTAGGGTDILARVVAERLKARYQQNFLVENMAGAGTMIATNYVRKQSPDGYTIYLVGAGFTVTPAVDPDANYNPTAILDPVARLTSILNIIIANNDVPANNGAELITFLRANSGKVNWGVTVLGSLDHLVAEMIAQRAGVKLVFVGYKGASQATQDLLGGIIHLQGVTYAATKPLLDARKVKILGIPELVRSPVLPNVPTFAESGFPGLNAVSYYGIVAPLGTPRDVINSLNEALVGIIRAPDMTDRLIALGLYPAPGTPEQYRESLNEDYQRWAKLVKDIGFKLEK